MILLVVIQLYIPCLTNGVLHDCMRVRDKMRQREWFDERELQIYYVSHQRCVFMNACTNWIRRDKGRNGEIVGGKVRQRVVRLD